MSRERQQQPGRAAEAAAGRRVRAAESLTESKASNFTLTDAVLSFFHYDPRVVEAARRQLMVMISNMFDIQDASGLSECFARGHTDDMLCVFLCVQLCVH